jgi:inorganic phosphate transporter, PiT family
MDGTVVYVLVIVLIALTFDFINGFHDSANSIATVVSTRVLSPGVAVFWAAFFNFIAAFIVGTAVAKTIGKGLIVVDVVDPSVILGGLIGAIVWDLVTWWGGLPSSSSHALLGGLAGAAIAKAGFAALIPGGWTLPLLFILISPLLGMVVSLLLTVGLSWGLRNAPPGPLDRIFRRLQLISAALYSLSHGANDAQKTMGIILVLLIASGQVTPEADVPLWVVLAAHTAIGLGTLSGGWRIVKTMGSKITRLQPVGGVAAESAAAATLFFTSSAGIPVSTTHTITGAIIGVGASRRLSAVRWGVAGEVVTAWILTIPGAFTIAFVTSLAVRAVA